MRKNIKKPMPDMHDEAWWLRALDGYLSIDEMQLWEDHLNRCEACRREWAALNDLDTMLRTAEPPPLLPDDFTARTLTRVMRQQHVQRLLSFMSSAFIILFVSWVVLQFLGSTYTSVERVAAFVIVERHTLLSAFIQTLTAFLISWKTFFPLFFGAAGLAFLLLMPNGIMTTLMIFWLARRRLALTSVPVEELS